MCGSWTLIGVGGVRVGREMRRGCILLLLWRRVLSLLPIAATLAIITCRRHGNSLVFNVGISRPFKEYITCHQGREKTR